MIDPFIHIEHARRHQALCGVDPRTLRITSLTWRVGDGWAWAEPTCGTCQLLALAEPHTVCYDDPISIGIIPQKDG